MAKFAVLPIVREAPRCSVDLHTSHADALFKQASQFYLLTCEEG